MTDQIKRLKGNHVSELGRDPGNIQMCQVTNFSQACTGSRIFGALKKPATVKAEMLVEIMTLGNCKTCRSHLSFIYFLFFFLLLQQVDARTRVS